MKSRAFNFEVQDVLTQFIAAIDDTVVGRWNADRVERDRIEVGYVYAPKKRVLHDIVNTAQTIKLPMGAISITSQGRDNDRSFNKSHGFLYSGAKRLTYPENSSVYLPPAVPWNISLNLSLITRYQSDMDQLVQNFAAYVNPYFIISWKVPEAFGLLEDHEIRSEVLWDQTINLDYPVDVKWSDNHIITADTTFVIKSWLFKEVPEEPVKNIYFINANFHTSKILSAGNYVTYDDYVSLSAESMDAVYSDNLVGIVSVETISVSGSPSITDAFYVLSGANSAPITLENYIIGDPGRTVLYGKRFNYTSHVYLSADNESLYGELTASHTYAYFPSFSAALVPLSAYRIITDNVMEIEPLTFSGTGKFDYIIATEAGWATSYDGISGHFVVQ